MKEVQVSPAARQQMDIFNRLGQPLTGFLEGIRLGKEVIIEHLLSLPFDEATIDYTYHHVFQVKGEKILGVFFCNRQLFFSEWFLEDLVLLIQGADAALVRYRPVK